MEDIGVLQDWVTARMIRGQYIFTKEDVQAIGLPISNEALINSLVRMGKRGVIMSPWQNFYVTIPTEYKLKGVVPPSPPWVKHSTGQPFNNTTNTFLHFAIQKY